MPKLIHPRRPDRTLVGGYPCRCDPRDTRVCAFPDVAGVPVPHHAYCPRYRAATRCHLQKQLWLAVAAKFVRKPGRTCRFCCRNCVVVRNLSGHCCHCRRSDRFLAAQAHAVGWGHLLHRLTAPEGR